MCGRSAAGRTKSMGDPGKPGETTGKKHHWCESKVYTLLHHMSHSGPMCLLGARGAKILEAVALPSERCWDDGPSSLREGAGVVAGIL